MGCQIVKSIIDEVSLMREAVVVFMQDRGFNSFASNMIKLSVSEQNEVVC